MYIVIVGGGKVGEAAARELVAAGHEVLLIERELAKVNVINDELGEIAVWGDGAEVRMQAEAGMERVDLVVAATGRDETNLAVVQVARLRFHVPRAIVRINNPKNEEIFRVLGVAVPVSATQAIMAQIEQELPSSQVIHLLELYGSPFELVEVVVPEGARTAGRTVGSFTLPAEILLSLIVHADGRPEVPTAETVVDEGAVILAVTLPEHEARLRRVLTEGE